MNKVISWMKERKEMLFFLMFSGMFGVMMRVSFFLRARGLIIPDVFEFTTVMASAEKFIGRVLSFFSTVPFKILDYFVFNASVEWKYSISFFFFYYFAFGLIAYLIAGKLKYKRKALVAIGILLVEIIIMGVIL